jgi:hypothetical protein
MTDRPTIDRAKPAPLIGAVVIFVSLGAVLMSSRANEPNESDDKQPSGAAAARELLQSLPEAKLTQAKLPFDSSERTNWNYVPTSRAGVALTELDANQKSLVDPLLHSALSPAGFETARQIVQHESILAEIEGNARRDPQLRVHPGRGDSKAIIFLSTRPMSTVKLKSWRRSSWGRTPRACRTVRKPVCACSRQKKIGLAS